MSVFDKLKAYSRKPAAVILATVMATSTIPTTPIAQAVTAAYAESTTTQSAKGAETTEAKVTPADLGIKETPWDGKSDITLTFSTHIDKGEAVATISADQVKALVKDQLENSEDFKNQFVYTKNGQDALSKQIDAKLAEINKDVLPKKNVTSEDGTEKTEYSNAVYKEDSMTREITACKVQLTNNTEGANSAATVNDDGSITIKSNGVISGTVNLKVTQLSVKVGFGYKYTKTVTKTTSSSSSSDGSTSKNNGGISIEVGTEDGNTTTTNKVPSNTTVTPTVVDNDADAKADVTLKDVTSGYGVWSTVSTASVTTEEYYAGIDSSTFADVNAEGLVYKTAHDDYVVFNGKDDKWVGLKGEIVSDKANDEFFDVKPTSTSLDKTKTVQITPKKAFEGDKTFTINWKYPNGKGAGTTTVHVKGIAKKPIDLSRLSNEKPLPFRLAKDQNAEILKTANDLVKDATDGEVSDLYKLVTINEEKYNEAAKADMEFDSSVLTFEVRDSKGSSDKLNDYDFTVDGNQVTQPKVKVAKIEEIDWDEQSGITLTGLTYNEDYYKNQGNKDYSKTIHKADKNLWYRNAATVGVDGKNAVAVSQDIEDNQTVADLDFGKQQTFKTSASANQLAKFYTQNSDKVIKRVRDVNFNYDHTKPSLTSFTATASGDRKTELKSGSHAGALVADRITVDFEAKDSGSNEAAGVSGIADVQANYQIQKSGQKTATPKAEDYGKYAFDIDEDSKVSTDSIHVKTVDHAGNANDQTLAEASIDPKYTELVRASSAPEISSSWDTTAASNGKYYNVSRTLTLTIKAPFYEYVQEYMANVPIATVTRDGKSWKSVFPTDFKETSEGSNVYTCPISFTEDGDYVVSECVVTDLVGRSAKVDGDTFTIDKTAPKLNVSWNTEAAQNGKYYNAARTATITVEEHNFDPNLFKIEAPVSAGNGDEATPAQIGGWSSNGDTHTATVTFPGQGVYTLSVSGEDLASNKSESYTSPEFVIDTIKPKIDIQNVVNRTAYAGEVAPTAAVHDTNLADGTSIEVSKISYPLSKDDPNPYAGAAINTSATDKSVSYLNPAKTKGNDGVYTLTVQAIDLAGNTESEAVTWSVNRFGSTYVISDNTGKMLDQYLKSSKTTDVKVTEINPSGLDDNKTSVELTRDTKNTTLKSGDNYTTDANTASGWSEYNYTVSKSNYDKDGAYRVLFHSEDAAGNSSENTMEGKNAKKSGAAAEINFAVDDTAPIASFVDLASNGKYEESSHKAKVSFEDNLKLSKAQIKVNGKTVATFTADQLEKSPIREFTLDGSSSKQDVSVVAWDAAGNKSKELKATGVLVTNDSFVLWMNNLPLMVGTIVAIVVVAGGIYMVVAKKRKENEEK